jgi:tRNA modification GTPase
MHERETICSISTAPGEGGIGIIRISGDDAIAVASRVFVPHKSRAFGKTSHRLQYGRVMDPRTGEIVDEALVSVMRAPATYTREDVVEINCHGGMMPLSRTLALIIAAGARQALPGEFTKRAFLNGRIDLSQAEAVMDIIHAKTDLAHKAAQEQLLGGLSREIALLREPLIGIMASVEAAIDFPEEDIETSSGTALSDEIAGAIAAIDAMLASVACGRVLREGFRTAIVGRPNVGKSSLLNALLRQDRAIVTEIPGTTRDVLEEFLNIAGVPLRILDTAGIRYSQDIVEQEGVRRSLAAIHGADMVLVVLDGSHELAEEDQRVLNEIQGKPAVIVINKADLPRRLGSIEHAGLRVSVSCRTGAGLDELRAAVSSLVLQGTVAARGTHAWAVNQRHQTALEQAKESLARVQGSVQEGLSPEFPAVDLRIALDQLNIIIGVTYTEDILERIFNEFCIGK